ncbi:cytochrome c [Candidatus Obscuribacterales bacterium]|nr:cytochrome c [Candidatus Obscuribacterales bacterium]
MNLSFRPLKFPVAMSFMVAGSIVLSICSTGSAEDLYTHMLQRPIFNENQLNKEQKPVENDVDNMDQCAGTMRHYRFPPSGFEPRKPDAQSRHGKQLYKEQNCVQCHAIKGQGGELGPPLDGIGGHRGKEWLVARLLDPEKQMRDFPDVFDRRKNVMPHPGVSEEDASAISDYLLTLPEPELGWVVSSHPASADDKSNGSDLAFKTSNASSIRGAKLFVQLYCASCHSTDGEGNRAGPDLRGIGTRLSESELEQVLTGSAKFMTMRAITTSIEKDELTDLKAFLLTLK